MIDAQVEPGIMRPAPLWLWLSLFSATLVTAMLGNYWYVPSGVWKPIHELSHGLVNATLQWGLASILVVIGGILLLAGRRTLLEVGIDGRKIISGVAFTCVLWLLVQFALGFCYVVLGESPHLANGWKAPNILDNLGGFLGQFLGSALFEEILFRGFLFVQCWTLFRARWPRRPALAFAAALGMATAIFTLLHLPALISPHKFTSWFVLGRVLIEIFLSGCVFGWVYWRTDNLFFATGVHALANVPMTLFVWQDLGRLTRADPVVLLIAVGIAAVWHRLFATDRRPVDSRFESDRGSERSPGPRSE